MYDMYKLVLKYMRCESETAWSTVYLYSKSMLNCIDFTVYSQVVSVQ